ncbi:hypothetical protein [Brevibacillus sp. NRS-1366]|uniref:hypothetical protein n=1 Tax=Brevibacillus sp. NRS-1366 TaxID=3233899 RepID=UPI003D1F4E17
MSPYPPLGKGQIDQLFLAYIGYSIGSDGTPHYQFWEPNDFVPLLQPNTISMFSIIWMPRLLLPTGRVWESTSSLIWALRMTRPSAIGSVRI